MISGDIDVTELTGVINNYTNLEGSMMTAGPKGDKGDKGERGDTGSQGFSPIATVTKVDDTATISITDKTGTTTASITDGDDGEDGYSPSANVTKSGKVATITITDKTGTTTCEIRDGEDGQGSGDMLKATYDTNDNGIVDNAEKVNNHTVLTDVPVNAVFTDTTYTAGTGIDITNGVISNTQTSAEWGNITGTLSNQTDLNTALSGKQGTLTAGTNIQINNNTISATDTTYESKTASQGGTDVSLCTTGEKYTWNNKQDTLVSGTNIKTINSTSLLGSGDITINAEDEIAIQTTQPTGNETLWIEPGFTPTIAGNEIEILTGTIEINGDTTYSAETINYPSGYTYSNCVVISTMVHGSSSSTKWSTIDVSESPLGIVLGNSPMFVTLDNDNIIIRAKNNSGDSYTRTISYKVVLLRIS